MRERRTRSASDLRREFDERFAAPLAESAGALQSLLSVRVAGERFVIRVDEITTIARCPKITPLPSRAPSLVGLVGLRGALVPVFSLARLLGFATEDEPRWLVTCAARVSEGHTLGFAFGAYDAHSRVPASAIDRSGPLQSSLRVNGRPHISAVVELDDALHVIIDLKSLLAELGAGAP